MTIAYRVPCMGCGTVLEFSSIRVALLRLYCDACVSKMKGAAPE